MPEDAETTTSQEGARPAPVVRLRWLRIESFRNVHRGTELRFDDSATIVLGRNGSGKSTLLGLIAAVISSEFRLLDEPYDLRYRLQIGDTTAECHALGTHTNPLVLPGLSARGAAPRAVRSGGQDGRSLRRSFETKLVGGDGHEIMTVAIDSRTTRITIPGMVPHVAGDIWGVETPVLSRVALLGGATFDSFRVPELPPEVASAAQALGATVRRLDESLDTLRGFGETPAEVTHLLPAPYVVVVRKVATDGGLTDQQPGTALSVLGVGGPMWQRFVDSERVPTREDIVVDASEAPFLAVFAEAIGAASAQLRLHFTGMDVLEGTENWRYTRISFHVTRKNGEILPHEKLSYGQKRLLAYLYYAALNQYVIVADELVNGLHHSWIQSCLEQLGDRQAFFTSQNPVLLDFLPPGSAEQAAKQYVQCREESGPAGDELVWENMSAEDGQRVFDACEVGIQPVSRVLESKGLW